MKKCRSLLALAAALVLAFSCAVSVSAGTIEFTVQPKGGETDNFTDFAVTWQTNASCRVMLQSREDETYDWGNNDYVESPLVMNFANYTQEYRLMATDGSDEAYSEPFRITWRPADNCTKAALEDVDFGRLAVGFSAPTLPVTVKNVGGETLRSPVLEVGGGTNYFEVVVNRAPHDLAPGETDSETWSVRPLPGLGAGDYSESLFLSSPALADYACCLARVSVISNGNDGETHIEADDVNLGTLVQGYPEQDDKDLVIRAVGGGTLKKVHLYIGDADTSFFDLRANNASIDEIAAGTDSGSNWYLKLRSGLEPGYFECTILACAEGVEPVEVKISATILPDGVDDVPASISVDGTAAQTQTDADAEPTKSAKPSGDKEEGDSQTGLLIAVIAAAVVICAAVITVSLIAVNRAKKNAGK